MASHEGMRALLSRPHGHEVRPVETALEPIPFQLQPVERYLEIARASRPSIRMARAGRDAREALADAKSAELLPTLVLVGDARVTDSDVISDESTVLGAETLGLSAGMLLGMQWDLNVPSKLFQRDEARAEARKAAAQVTIAQEMASVEIHRLVQSLESKVLMMTTYRKAQKAAQGWLTASWDLYDSGFGSFRDVMDALVQFYRRKVGYLQTVHEHNLLVHELSRAIGSDVTSLVDAGP